MEKHINQNHLLTIAVAGGVGPVLGGVLTEKLSWEWCFWVNLPIAGTTFLLLLIFLDVHNPRTGVLVGLKAVDWFGSLSILAMTLMLLLGLEFGGATFPVSLLNPDRGPKRSNREFADV